MTIILSNIFYFTQIKESFTFNINIKIMDILNQSIDSKDIKK